jgi:hypothetical protein
MIEVRFDVSVASAPGPVARYPLIAARTKIDRRTGGILVILGGSRLANTGVAR